MRISAKADYAVRAAIELAAAPDDKPVSAERIASAQEIPVNFLENILGELRTAGIVRSQRGAEGGFRLAKGADRADHRRHHPRGGGPARQRPGWQARRTPSIPGR
jgi:Rrf2 family protein